MADSTCASNTAEGALAAGVVVVLVVALLLLPLPLNAAAAAAVCGDKLSDIMTFLPHGPWASTTSRFKDQGV